MTETWTWGKKWKRELLQSGEIRITGRFNSIADAADATKYVVRTNFAQVPAGYKVSDVRIASDATLTITYTK